MKRAYTITAVLCAAVVLVVIALTRCGSAPAPPTPKAREARTPPPILHEPRPTVRIRGELGTPSPAGAGTPEATPRQTSPELEQELAEDEQALRAGIAEMKQQIGERIQSVTSENPPPHQEPPPPSAEIVRELDLSGWPQDVVAQVMERYGLRVEKRFVTSFTRNTFVSQATLEGDHYYSVNGKVQPGLYDVFELTPRAIARMSALEEEELRRRGLEPGRCIVRHVVFGIRQSGDGYDLGVLAMEATPVP